MRAVGQRFFYLLSFTRSLRFQTFRLRLFGRDQRFTFCKQRVYHPVQIDFTRSDGQTVRRAVGKKKQTRTSQ